VQQASDVAAAVTHPGQDDDASVSRVAPLLRTRSSELLERVSALRVRTMEVNAHFEAEGFRMDLCPGLANVRCPVLVVFGDQDILTPPHLVQQLVDALPAGLGRLEVVPEASHDVLTDNPEVAWSVIRGFIGQLH